MIRFESVYYKHLLTNPKTGSHLLKDVSLWELIEKIGSCIIGIFKRLGRSIKCCGHSPTPSLSNKVIEPVRTIQPPLRNPATAFTIPKPETNQKYTPNPSIENAESSFRGGVVVVVDGNPIVNEKGETTLNEKGETTFDLLTTALSSYDRGIFLPLFNQDAFDPLIRELTQRLLANADLRSIPKELAKNGVVFTYHISTEEKTLRISYTTVYSTKHDVHEIENDPAKVVFDASITYDLNTYTCTYSHLPNTALADVSLPTPPYAEEAPLTPPSSNFQPLTPTP